MKIFNLILILSSLIVGKVDAQDAVGNSSEEKKVLKLVNSLPENISSNQGRPKNRQIRAYIESTPTLSQKYYLVSVCDTSANRLFAYYRFRVYLPHYTIYYDDFDAGKLVPYKKWDQYPYGIYSKPDYSSRGTHE